MLSTLLKTLFPTSTKRELSYPDVTNHQATNHLTSTHRSAYRPGCNTIRLSS